MVVAKVFISHRGTDAIQAERLALDMRAAGHDVWLDVWKIKPGDSIVQKISDGLETADYVAVCYSSADVGGAWYDREWESTLSRQLEGHGVKLLPVLLTGRRPPAILHGIKAADLISDWPAGVANLLRAIR